MNVDRRVITSSFLILVACLTAGAAHGSVTPGISPNALREVPEGTVLSKQNWEIAKGYLPDEILALYQRGDYAHPIHKLEGKLGTVTDERLVEISVRNEGKFDVDENGTVVDVKTGVRPPVIIGWPFPKIDPNDPKAGAKAMWNHLYTMHWAGSFHTQSPVNWMSREGGLLRRISVDVHFKYYDGQPPEFQERIGENPLNVLNRTMAVVKEPADVNGLVTLNWRYREGDKEDQSWTYVPALRRVRPINPANRADGFLGSDISQDDAPYFDGKPEGFTFKLVGDGWTLATYDIKGLETLMTTRRLTHETEISPLVSGSETGWRVSYPTTRLIASQDENWKSGEGQVSWAPLQVALVPRPVWVVEVTPKNPYYLYGKQVMLFDKDTFRGYWKSKYDWKGNLLMSWQVPEGMFRKLDGPPGYIRNLSAGGIGVMNNFKEDRATVSGLPVADTEWWVDIPDQIFEVERITRYGK